MNAAPIADQDSHSEAITRAPRALGRHGFLAQDCRITALRRVAHKGCSGFPRFRERERRACAKWHAPFVSMQRVLAEKVSSAARSHTPGKSTLSFIENEPVLA